MNSLKTRTTRIVLEKRIVFDAAAVTTAVKTTTDPTVTDMTALSDQLSTTNSPPVANDDIATTDAATAITVNVLENDSDSDGNTLSLVAPATGYGLQISGPDVNIPTFLLTNTSDSAEITNFRFSIGDTAYNFDFIQDVVPSDITYSQTDVELSFNNSGNSGLRTDELNFDFLSGFTSGAKFQFSSDVDRDSRDRMQNFQSIFFNNGESVNSTITVAFSNGVELSMQLPEMPQPDQNGNYIFSQEVTSRTSNTDAGTFNLNDDNTITFTPNETFTGQTSYTYTVTDGNGGYDTALLTVVKNSDPVAKPDTVETNEDTPLTFSVTANDTDADNDPLFVTEYSQTENGTVVQNDDGSFTYTPDANFDGDDSFTYQVSDGHGGMAMATVDITVNNHDVTQTWTGAAGDGDFFNGDNWSLGLIPGNGDSLVIPDQPGDISLTGMDITLHSLTLSDTLTVDHAQLTVSGDATIQAGGVLNITPDGIFTVTGGTLTNNGLIEGKGNLDVSKNATFINNGTIGPGNSPGRLNIQGDFIQTDTGTLMFEIAGTQPATQYDQLFVSGTAFLNGSINIVFINGLTSLPDGTSLQLLQASSIQGNPTINAPDGFNFDLLSGAITFSGTTDPSAFNDSDTISGIITNENGFTIQAVSRDLNFPDYYSGLNTLDDYSNLFTGQGDTWSEILRGLALSLTDYSGNDYASAFERLLSDDPTAAGEHDKSLDEKLDEEASHFDARQLEILDILLRAEEAMFCEA